MTKLRVVTEETLKKILTSKEQCCRCGCEWGPDSGTEWQIQLLKGILKNEIVEIEVNNDNS